MLTPIAEGQRIQYNFVKPHEALEGQTPAESAGIGVEGWNQLLLKGLERSLRNAHKEGSS